MSESKKIGIESIGYTEAQIEVLKRSRESDSVQISGFTTIIKKTNVAKLVSDLASEDKPLEYCGKHD